jgi:hypothetical protein
MSEAQAKVKLLALVSDCELARAELEDLTARQNEARKTYLRLAEKRFYEEITTIEGGVPWDKLCWPSSSHYNDNKREDMRSASGMEASREAASASARFPSLTCLPMKRACPSRFAT